MLTRDTLKFLNKGFKRSLSRRIYAPDQSPRFRVKIPKDKLDLLVGATLEDRYYVLSLLGKGGMSLVYKAKNLETGEIVAVKCLRTQVLKDETVVKRFKREAEVLNRLNHPRIVQFYSYGTNKRGQPYFIMDYLIGVSLSEILRTGGAMDLGRFQDIFVQVAAAIGHAHKHGAVHRDIKPGNIMLVERGGTNDYVKIVDFGIAKVTEGTQQLTRLGEVWGSPIYMSPEQCMGTTTIDFRSDIYSLGIVMYEALTGEVPFLGRNYAETMMKQISEEPPSFKEVNDKIEIPPVLEQIVMRAIKKRPDDRYQSMVDLKRDLEHALAAVETPIQRSGSFLGISRKQEAPYVEPSNRPEKRTTTSDRLSNPVPSSNRVTSDDLTPVDRDTGDNESLRQRTTSEEISQFPKGNKPGDQRNTEPDINFEPPEPLRQKFELTGPQVISASTEGVQPPVKRTKGGDLEETMPPDGGIANKIRGSINRSRSDSGREIRVGDESAPVDRTPPVSRRRDSQNRLPGSRGRDSQNRLPGGRGRDSQNRLRGQRDDQSGDNGSSRRTSEGSRRGRISRNRLPGSTARDTMPRTAGGAKRKTSSHGSDTLKIFVLAVAVLFGSILLVVSIAYLANVRNMEGLNHLLHETLFVAPDQSGDYQENKPAASDKTPLPKEPDSPAKPNDTSDKQTIYEGELQ